MIPTVPDRRAALKAQHRSAILTAAQALLEERQGSSFSVDELANRADVARRTVFNHFSSLDEVLLTVCTDALSVLIDDFLSSVSRTPIGDGSRSGMLDELVTAMQESDLVSTIAAMVRGLGGPDSANARAPELTEAAFSRTSIRLTSEVLRRYPAADALDVELLVGSLMSGVAIISNHWVERTRAGIDAGSRAEWDRLLARLLHSLRSDNLST